MGQMWHHVPLLGGSLAFLGTEVEWDLVLLGLSSHERKPIPSAWADDGGKRLHLVLTLLEHLPLVPRPLPREQNRQVPGTEATATRTHHSPHPVSKDSVTRVTGNGCSLWWCPKVSFKNKFENLTKFHQFKD